MVMKTVEQAIENMEYVRRLLRQKQPGFAASLELAASQLERKRREPACSPGTGAVGRSLQEWTTKSTAPRSNAARRVVVNTPVVPSRSIGAVDSSPGVTTVTTTHGWPHRSRNCRAIQPAWASASGLPRVPSRNGRWCGEFMRWPYLF